MKYKEFEDLVFNTEKEAIDVLGMIVAIKTSYGFVTVEDLKDILGMSSVYTDRQWGWSNIEGFTIQPATPRTMYVSYSKSSGRKYRLNVPHAELKKEPKVVFLDNKSKSVVGPVIFITKPKEPIKIDVDIPKQNMQNLAEDLYMKLKNPNGGESSSPKDEVIETTTIVITKYADGRIKEVTTVERGNKNVK